MDARDDIPTYANAAAKLTNVYVLHQGGLTRREGLEWVAFTVSQRKEIEFTFNTEQDYLLVFTPGKMTVYKDDVFQVAVTTSPMTDITGDMLATMNYTQSADTLLLFHGDLKTLRITRTSHTTWNVDYAPFTNIPDFDFGAGAEPVISASRGYPVSGVFAKGRFWMAGLQSRPQTFLGSKSGLYYDFDEGTGLDNEAINVTLDSGEVNAIQHIILGHNILIFTSGGEWYIQPALGDAITPSKIADQLIQGTSEGSTLARPVSVGGNPVFIQKGGAAALQFVFSGNGLDASYTAPNISIFSPHLIKNPVRMAVRRPTPKIPASILYAVNEDGTVSILNLLDQEQLVAWAEWTTDGEFQDVAIVNDEVYFSVKRVIGGQTLYTIEKLNANLRLDCAKTASNASPTQSWMGFSYLNNQEVYVFGDDYTLLPATVSGGGLMSNEAVKSLEVGFPFLAELTILPVSIIVQGQNFQGDVKRLVYVLLKMLNSRGIVVKTLKKTYRSTWRKFGPAAINVPVKLHTGWKKYTVSGVGRDGQVNITQEDPLEWTITAVKVGVAV